MGFSVKFSPFLLSAGTTGTYGIEGEFINSEPSKKPDGTPYQFSDININGSHYFIDIEGNIFSIVVSNVSGPNSFPYIEVNNLVGESYAPQVADGLIAIINPITMQFYITSTVSQSLKAKIQRINVRDLIVSSGSGDNIYNSDGTIAVNREVTLANNSLSFVDGVSRVDINALQLKLSNMELEVNENLIQSSDGARWLQNITAIGSTIKTKL